MVKVHINGQMVTCTSEHFWIRRRQAKVFGDKVININIKVITKKTQGMAKGLSHGEKLVPNMKVAIWKTANMAMAR